MSDDQSRPVGGAKCASCGAARAADQRYCLSCGTRILPVPLVVANWLERVRPKPKDGQSPAGVSETGGEPEAEEGGPASRMPTPQAVAVAVMALLAFGVIIGSVTQQLAQSAGIRTVVLSEPAAAPEPVAAAPEEVVEEVESVEPAPEPAAEEVLLEAPEEEEEEEEKGTPAKPPPPLELPPEASLPPISHVFLIVLGDQGYEDTFGAASQSAYFSKTLPEQGEVLSNYYAVSQGGLSNEIGLLSGQGPTVQTATNCPEYADLAASTVGPMEQVEGAGCVYPKEARTLPGQLVAAKLSWKAYVEDVGNGETGQPTTCRRPSLGALDPDWLPSAGDGYETWRNPFVYFHSIVDGDECAERDVGLDRLSFRPQDPETDSDPLLHRSRRLP